MFGPLKEVLAWNKLNADVEIKQAVYSWLKGQSEDVFFSSENLGISEAWQICIERGVDYVEIW